MKHHDSGWSVITSASGGYIVGFVVAAAVTGWLAERRWDRRFSSSVGAMLTGNVIIYLVGLPWHAWQLHTNFETTLEYGLYKFVPGDLLKHVEPIFRTQIQIQESRIELIIFKRPQPVFSGSDRFGVMAFVFNEQAGRVPKAKGAAATSVRWLRR